MEIKNFTTDIDKFLDNLEEITKSKVVEILDILELCGNEIGMPFSKPLSGGLFELRINGKLSVRIIYCFHDNCAVLLNVFIKKTAKIAKKELDLAKRRQNMLL